MLGDNYNSFLKKPSFNNSVNLDLTSEITVFFSLTLDKIFLWGKTFLKKEILENILYMEKL